MFCTFDVLLSCKNGSSSLPVCVFFRFHFLPTLSLNSVLRIPVQFPLSFNNNSSNSWIMTPFRLTMVNGVYAFDKIFCKPWL